MVVEDAAEFAQLAAQILRREGFEVAVAATGEDGLTILRTQPVELVVVDVMLPGIDGFEVCRRLRTFTDAYVIMVTARDEEAEKVIGLEIGADDYVTKPYSPRELSARIAAMRRRPRASAAAQVAVFDRLALDETSREISIDGAVVDLTRTEYELASILMAAPRRVFSRGQLLETIWGYSGGDDRVVGVHTANMRRKITAKLGQDPFQTVRGVGFRFEPSRCQ